MGQMLRSWQEIATYVGKGLRTVQRWEREINFPVHRTGNDKRCVVGFTDEINEWMCRSQKAGISGTSAPAVHDALAARRTQMAKLREQVERAREQTAIMHARLAELTAKRSQMRSREDVTIIYPHEPSRL